MPAATKRYQDLITRMSSTLRLKRDERLRVSEPDRILILDAEIDNLEEAIELFREAQSGDFEETQFGAESARNMRVQLPPSSSEYHFPPMVFNRYVYRTAEPVEIVYLRRLCQDQKRYPGLREMAPGLHAAVSKDGVVINFYPESMMADLANAHVLKSQMIG